MGKCDPERNTRDFWNLNGIINFFWEWMVLSSAIRFSCTEECQIYIGCVINEPERISVYFELNMYLTYSNKQKCRKCEIDMNWIGRLDFAFGWLSVEQKNIHQIVRLSMRWLLLSLTSFLLPYFLKWSLMFTNMVNYLTYTPEIHTTFYIFMRRCYSCLICC